MSHAQSRLKGEEAMAFAIKVNGNAHYRSRQPAGGIALGYGYDERGRIALTREMRQLG